MAIPLFSAARTIQGYEAKEEEVGSLHQLWHDHLAIEGGEGRVVDISAVIVLEMSEACVLDAVSLRGRGRENDAFGQLLSGLELDLVIGTGQHPNSLCGALIFRRHSVRQAELFRLQTGAKFFQYKRLSQSVHDPAREFTVQSQFKEFPLEQRLLIPLRNLPRLGEEIGGG